MHNSYIVCSIAKAPRLILVCLGRLCRRSTYCGACGAEICTYLGCKGFFLHRGRIGRGGSLGHSGKTRCKSSVWRKYSPLEWGNAWAKVRILGLK